MQKLTTLIVMAKEPLPGRVKTRLTPPLAQHLAADLAAAFVFDLTHRLHELKGVRTVVALPPGDTSGRLADGVPDGVAFVDQGPGDLGEKLTRVLDDAFTQGADAALAIGGDHPNVPLALVAEAIDAARSGGAAWVPTRDGGFACIALPRPLPGLFRAIPWSSPRTAETLRNNARHLGVSLHTPGTWYDVDTIADLRHVRDDPESIRRCPRTMGLLREHGAALDGEGDGVSR